MIDLVSSIIGAMILTWVLVTTPGRIPSRNREAEIPDFEREKRDDSNDSDSLLEFVLCISYVNGLYSIRICSCICKVSVLFIQT